VIDAFRPSRGHLDCKDLGLNSEWMYVVDVEDVFDKVAINFTWLRLS
jgi:hypothetical protein